MISKTLMGSLISAFVLSGCATTFYTYSGNKYNSAEEFHAAVDQDNNIRLSTITPLKEPISSKSLIYAYAGVATIEAENERRFNKLNNKPRPTQTQEMQKNLSIGIHKAITTQCEFIKKRNIYKSVDCREMDQMTIDLPASDAYDTMFFSESDAGTGQWYYNSKKHGKQVFVFDMSSTDPVTRTRNYLSAVEALAVRN